MFDRLYLPLLGVLTIATIALALVWPQALGDRSPGPFGHNPVQRDPAMQAALRRETETAQSHDRAARDAVRDLQSQALSPDK